MSILLVCALPRPVLGRVPSTAIDRAVEKNVAEGFSGNVLVAHGDRILLNRSYGSIHGVPMRPESRFWISSMGKQFVSASILKLQEQGRVRLDDPISRYFSDVPPDKRGITVRMLLSHTSRLPQGYVGEEASSNAEAVRGILAVPLAAPTKTGFLYSNDNYQLAAAIVERAGGRSLGDFERRNFFAPLGMRDTGVANGPAGVLPTRDPTPGRLLEPQWGIEGHYSSAPDLFRWYRALVSGRMLRPESVRTLMTPVIKTQETNAALGWFVDSAPHGTKRVWTRGNDDFGPNSLIYSYPDKDLVIIVLTHGGDKNDDMSWSKAMLASIEQAMQL